MKAQVKPESRTGTPWGKAAVSVLLICGVASSLLYVATDVLAAMSWDAYSYTSQSVSQLLAIGTPTRAFVFPLMAAYNILVCAFGLGVWAAAKRNRALRVTGFLLFVYGVISYMALTMFSLNAGETEASSGAGAHIAVTMVLVLLMFLFMAFGAAARGRAFRIYSILTIVALIAGGGLTGMQVEALETRGSAPMLGVIERVNIYSTMLWVAVLGVLLLRDLLSSRSTQGEPVAGDRPKKKVLAFVGSAQKRGATYTAVSKFLGNLEAYGDVESEIVFVSDYEIGVCRGCRVCFDRGEDRCPMKDDRDVLIGKMQDADAVVFATPNYSWQVSGITKVFLDRLGFAFHRPRFHGKTATAIVVQGVYRGREIRKYLQFCAGALGFNVVRGSVIRTLKPMTEDALRKMDEALQKQSERFHERLLQPAFPVPSLFALLMFRMGRTGFRLGLPEDAADYRYYREHGWFESDYFYPTRLGPLKKALGAFGDWAGAHAFKVAEEPGVPVSVTHQ